MDFDWKKLLGTVAPWIGTALGGPLGGMAVTAAAKALGLDDATESSLKQALSGASPEQMLALKQADQSFAVQMQQMGFKQIIDLEKLAADDRDSARNREIKTGDTFTPRVLAAIVVLGWLWIQYVLLNKLIEPAMRDIVMQLIGVSNMALGTVLNYYFGSSAGSATKNDIIAKQASAGRSE